jgi:radical SAM superfamily enzyme YgiQ (UPF0313 family)
MKFTLIFPPLGHKGVKVRSFPLAPPVLEYLGGLISHHRPDWDLRLINANVEDVDPETLESDVVGITILTHQAKWAYRMADKLRLRGITVMLGGPHTSAMPDEASLHADTVLTGEAEAVIEKVLKDMESKTLKPKYTGELLPVNGLPFPRRDLLDGYIFHAFSTSRGCPYNCKFCTTPNLHGHKVRYRPIDEVIKDITSFRHKMWFSTDADIWGPDVKRYTELFRSMSNELPSMYWAGEGSLSAVQHPDGMEMLRWARRSGLMQVWVGWESFNPDTIVQYGAEPKLRGGREDALKKISDSGIDVVLFLMLGAKGEDMREYDRVLELSDKIGMTVHPVMVVPYPGTELRRELEDELIYMDNGEDDWDFYDGLHSVVRHVGAGIDNDARDRALVKLWVDLFTYPRIIKRIKNLSFRGFPSAHIASVMVQSALRKAFREYSVLID